MDYLREHPFKTYKDQLEILKSRGLTIADEKFAENALKNFSYYTLVNGYKDLLIEKNTKNGQEKFKEDATFSMLYQLHWIDLTMSNILFKYTLTVEKKLKSSTSYVVSKNYGVDESIYLKRNNYSPQKYHRGKIAEFCRQINEIKNRDPSAIHYMQSEGNLPPWIAAKAISFGNIVNWYQVLRGPHKEYVVKSFFPSLYPLKTDDQKEFFDIAIKQVYEYRNLVAHGNRTFSLRVPDRQKVKYLKALNLIEYYPNECEPPATDNLYSVIMSILMLIDDDYVLGQFLTEITNFFNLYDSGDFQFLDANIYTLFDFPENALEQLTKYIKKKIL